MREGLRRRGELGSLGPRLGTWPCLLHLVLLIQVILGEIFSDYTPAQVVVKELRASAGPLEQRKFISEAQPYRYEGLSASWVLECPALHLHGGNTGERRSVVWDCILSLSLPGCVAWAQEFPF